MNQLTSEPKSSAAYGHACMNCVKAKCKCIPRDEGSSCERCHRLAKDCHPSTSIRKRAARRPYPSPSKTSKLEDKLDNLVSLLQSQSTSNPSLSFASPSLAQTDQHNTELPSHINKPLDNSHGRKIQSRTYLPPTPSDRSPSSICQTPELDPGRAISIFRDRFLVHFPLIYIPKEQPIEQFVRERPLTFQAIAALSEFAGERQVARAKLVREQIALRAVAGSERSLDLILATLISTVWQIYFTKAKPDIGMFASVCGSLIKDLRLVKHSVPLCMAKVPPLYDIPESKETLSDDERRAVLAYYIITAILSAYIKFEAWQWAPFMEDACRGLMRNHQIPGDRILVALVRIYKVSEEATKVMKHASENPDQVSTALLQVKLLRAMLDEVENELGQEERQSRTVQSCLHSTSILVYEAVLIVSSAFTSTSTIPDPTINLQCITYLTSCLHSCRTALETFLGLRFESVNISMVFSWMHAMQVLFKLSVLDFPNWDRNVSRATADPIHYIARSVTMMQNAYEDLKALSGSSENLFSKAHENLASRIEIWKEHLDNHDAMAAAAAAVSIPGATSSSAPTMEGGLMQDSFGSGNLAMGFDVMDTSWLSFSDDMFFPNLFA